MKRLSFMLSCVCAFFLMASCGAPSPADEAARCIDYLMEKDYVAIVETINVKGDTPEKQQASKQQLLELMEQKGDHMYEQKGGIASYSLVSEQISEDGMKAKVEYEVTYGNGAKEVEKFSMVMVDGVWKQDISK